MKKITRRQFTKAASIVAGGVAFPNIAFSAKPKVVVVGGGAGGATAARYLAKNHRGKLDEKGEKNCWRDEKKSLVKNDEKRYKLLTLICENMMQIYENRKSITENNSLKRL